MKRGMRWLAALAGLLAALSVGLAGLGEAAGGPTPNPSVGGGAQALSSMPDLDACLAGEGLYPAAGPAEADGGGAEAPTPKLYAGFGDGAAPSLYADSGAGTAPVLTVDRTEAAADEVFTLSWNEPGAKYVNLYVLRDDCPDFDCIYSGEPAHEFQTSLGECIRMQFTILVHYEDSYTQSNFVAVNLNTSTADILRARGFDNEWNVLALIYPEVDTPLLKTRWDEDDIAEITACLQKMPRVVKGLSNGRMRIGRLDILTMDEVVTSTSGGDNSLTYGEGGDVNFNYLFDHLDVQLVVVYTPVLEIATTWAGLGGGSIHYNGTSHYNIILNYFSTSRTLWSRGGNDYSVRVCWALHETLHAVETNSRRNAWGGFVPLHNANEQGYYQDPDYDYMEWYGDLMADTIRTGAPGFREESYLVRHNVIPAEMKKGIHEDSDGKVRVYANGLPDRSRGIVSYQGEWVPVRNGELFRYEHVLRLPQALTAVGPDAFSGTAVQWVQPGDGLERIESGAFADCPDLMGVVIPPSVNDIAPDAFRDSPQVVLYAVDNPYAEQYAQENGLRWERARG